MLDTDTLLTVHEAAERIGVSDSAIRNATLERRLPYVVKFGRKLIGQDALEAYRQRTQPGGIKPRGRPHAANPAAPPADPDERPTADAEADALTLRREGGSMSAEQH